MIVGHSLADTPIAAEMHGISLAGRGSMLLNRSGAYALFYPQHIGRK